MVIVEEEKRIGQEHRKERGKWEERQG